MANAPTPTARTENSDAPHVTPVTPEEDARTVLINEVNWGAVLAGVALALVSQLILNMIGISVGGAAISPAGGDNPSPSAFTVGAGLWWGISGIIAAFLGGIAAGRLAGVPKESTAGWHGLISWAFTTLVVFYMLGAAAGSIAGTAVQTVSSTASGLAQMAGGTMRNAVQMAAPAIGQSTDPFADIERAIRGSGQDPAAVQNAAIAAVRALLTGDQAQAQAARERAAEALARAQNVPVEQARNQVQQYETQYRQAVDRARQQATEAADAARSAVSRGSLFAAIALLLGAVASWFGGRVGAVDPTVSTERLRAVARRAMPGAARP